MKRLSAKYKIHVVDDEEKIISSVKAILSRQTEIEVVGCTSTSEALQLFEKSSQQFFENRIWRISNVASYTGYSLGTLYNLTSQNLIPHRKNRGRIFFMPLEIQNWIEEEIG